MGNGPWSDEMLDAKRSIGDPLADEVVADIFAEGEVDAVRKLLRHLVDNDHPLLVAEEDALPSPLREHIERYFDLSDADLPSFDPAQIVAGQQVFELHGPEVLMTLCCYSLPASYTARKGVQVLAQTGRLESNPKRRLIETTQMVVDVLTPGGLAIRDSARNHGKGIRSAQKVRLMHAAIRRMILVRYGDTWTADFGVPINQEDLAGTLMTFSQVVLDGLDRIGAPMGDDMRRSYLYTWQAIGRIMGIGEDMIPADLAQARLLTDTIKRRQIGRSESGDLLTTALLEMMHDMTHGFLAGMPPTLLRFFLQDDARYLAIPRSNWTEILVAMLHWTCRALDLVIGSTRITRALYRAFDRRMIAGMMRVERGPHRPNFDIPDHLATRWRIGEP